MSKQATEIKITASDVAAILRGDWDSVGEAVLSDVLRAIIDEGDTPPDGLVEALPVKVRASDDGSSDYAWACHGDDYEQVAKDLWDGADYGEGDYCVTVSWEATDAAGNEIDSGSFDMVGETEEPACPEAAEHDWTSEHEPGCDSNPGVWSTGGTSMAFTAHCRHCGMERVQHTTGSQRNPGECDTTTYSEPDPEWVAEHIDEE